MPVGVDCIDEAGVEILVGSLAESAGFEAMEAILVEIRCVAPIVASVDRC